MMEKKTKTKKTKLTTDVYNNNLFLEIFLRIE